MEAGISAAVENRADTAASSSALDPAQTGSSREPEQAPAFGLCPRSRSLLRKDVNAAVADTPRLYSTPEDLTHADGPGSDFLETAVFRPQTVGLGCARLAAGEVRMPTDRRTRRTEASRVQRRCSDCECLKNELQRDSKIVVPPLPGKALKRQLPIGGDEGIFEESLIEERRQGLQFINKTAGHPLAPNERCLHMFLQEEATDRNCPREGAPVGAPLTTCPLLSC
ncbi:sorting nexin-12-like [Ovis aries]|uniref:sorting nexin-12-like n=1 Tax=Ovis aries TaxID=9940 RepID=UPI001C2ECBA7|nr:sorting nexin-12-like [Ovis aries]